MLDKRLQCDSKLAVDRMYPARIINLEGIGSSNHNYIGHKLMFSSKYRLGGKFLVPQMFQQKAK